MFRNVVLLLFISLVWGVGISVIKIAEFDLKAVTVMAGRCSVGFIVLLIYCLVRKKDLIGNLKHLWIFATYSLLGLYLTWIFLAEGEEYTSAGISSITFSTIPLFTYAVLLFVLRTEKFKVLGVVGLLIGIIGLIFTIGYKNVLGGHSSSVGILLLSGSSLSFGINAIFAERFGKGIDPIISTTYFLAIGAVLLWITVLILGNPTDKHLTDIDIFSELYLGLLAVAGGYLAYYYMIQRAGSYFASLVFYLMPVFGVISGALLLHEQVSYKQIIGMGVVFTGVYLVKRENVKKE